VIIKRSREHRVNVGNYEHIIVSAAVELDIPDGVRIETALDQADRTLDDALAADLAAAEAAVPEDQETHLAYWKK